MPTRTVLLGKGAIAIRAAAWLQDRPDFDLMAIVPVIPEPTWTDSLSDWGAGAGIPVVDSGDFRDLDAALEIDLAVSVQYHTIFTPAFIARCDRIVNLHNGPLPRYRGVAPINWALKNGEHHHGVTLHEITPGIDAGPVIGQVIFSIYPDVDEVRDVFERASEFGYVLLTQTLPWLDRIVPRPQDEAHALYYTAGDAERLGDRRDFTRALSRQA